MIMLRRVPPPFGKLSSFSERFEVKSGRGTYGAILSVRPGNSADLVAHLTTPMANAARKNPSIVPFWRLYAARQKADLADPSPH
jgi:hypothetical protein